MNLHLHVQIAVLVMFCMAVHLLILLFLWHTPLFYIVCRSVTASVMRSKTALAAEKTPYSACRYALDLDLDWFI